MRPGYPHLTALQNIKMSLRGSKAKPAELKKRISDAVAMLNIGNCSRRSLPECRVANASASHGKGDCPKSRCLERWPDRADWLTSGYLRADRNPVRRRIHRFASDEFLERGPDDGRGRARHQKRVNRIALPKSLKLPAGGGKIEIGVRPQHFTLLQEKMDSAVPATVYVIERLRKENVIVLESENKDTIRVLTGHLWCLRWVSACLRNRTSRKSTTSHRNLRYRAVCRYRGPASHVTSLIVCPA